MSCSTNRRLAILPAYLATLALAAGLACSLAQERDEPLRVITSLPDYAWAVEQIGGERVEVASIAHGNQDAHFVRPRPSFRGLMRNADMFVTTGLDLELWVPALLDGAGNARILEGAPGYVAAWPGIDLQDVPDSISRSQGDIHVFGNPHIHTDPLNMALIGRNVLAGLERVDPARADVYRARAQAFEDQLHRRMFGDDLVELLGGETLARLERGGRLRAFLQSREYPRGSGTFLIDRLGGWLLRAEPLRGRKIIAYHKNWIYFARRFGLEIAGYVETKPGIPATPRHVESTMSTMRSEGIRVILSSNYFDPSKPQAIADRTNARLVIVPLSVDGAPGIDSYEKLIDSWIDGLLDGFGAEGGT